MRFRTVVTAFAASAAFAWQPAVVQLFHDRAVSVYAQVLSAVGLPVGSRQGIGRMRWPVAWKLNAPVSWSVTVNCVTWQPAQSRGFCVDACEPKKRAGSYARPQRPLSYQTTK